MSPRPRGWALVAFGILGVVGAFAYLFSGMFVLLIWFLQPNPGAELFVLTVKAVMAIGWIAIGIWTLLKFLRGRWWFLAGPPVAWAWLWVLGTVTQGTASLNWGY